MSKLNSHRSLIASLAGLFMAISTATAQTTWYVDDDNCPGPGSGTEVDPFCSVQDGIDGASGGDTIEVSPGTYNEAIDFLGKAITVLSSGGPEVTTMDATGLNTSVVTCVSGEGRGTVLDGFTITGGTGTDDYGDTFGGGMFTVAASPTVVNCKFIGNTCASGGGGGMYSNGGQPMVANCTFSGNTGTGSTAYGGGMWNNGSSPTVTNCTFSGNSAYSGGGIYNSASAVPTVTNCIFWGDTPDEIANSSSTPVVTYSDVQGGWAGTGNINADPLFVDPGAGNFRLYDFSPCADAGSNDAVPPAVTTDLDGNPRFVDDGGVEDTGLGDPPIVDMGAYERQSDSGEPVQVPGDYPTIQAAIDAAGVAGNEIIVAAGTYNEAIDFLGKAITVLSSGGPEVTTIDATGLNASVVTCVSGEGPGTVLDGFTITGGTGTEGSGGGMLNMESSPTVRNCRFTGNSADYGGGMFGYASSPTVTNCTFTGNWADSGGGGMYNNSGQPTVTNCTLSGNSTQYYGGGMWNNNSNATVTNCTFSGNSTQNYGGGMYNSASASPTVINCTFSGNSANYRWGGGMYNDSSSPTVINCTFTGNSADSGGGGMYNNSSSPTVTNCILWGDTPDEIANDSSTPVVTYSDVQGGWAGTGNINADPVFVDYGDLRLMPFSPCIDAGNSTALPVGLMADLDGNVRSVDDPATPDTGVAAYGATVDMGAYEVQAFHPADFNHDGFVSAFDLAQLLGAWGPWP